MPSRVMESNAGEDSTPSDNSEKSFVSAESERSENTSSRSSKGGSGSGQSALRSSSSLRVFKSIAPANFISSKAAGGGITDNTKGQHLSLSPKPKNSPPPFSPTGGSYFAQQPGASDREPRSPPNRRPPASRSSHGIETSSGPPPALSTQRSNTESPWRKSPSVDPRVAKPLVSQRPSTSPSIDSIVKQTYQSANEDSDSSPCNARAARSQSLTGEGLSIAMATRYSNRRLEEEEDQDPTLRIYGEKWNGESMTRNGDNQGQSYSSNEDLFLNLAKAEPVVDDGSETSTRRERRRSHIGNSNLPQARTSRPSSAGRPGTSGASFAGQQLSSKQNHHYKSSFDSAIQRSAEKGSLVSLRDAASSNRPYAASAHPLDQHFRTRIARSSFGSPPRDGLSQESSAAIPNGYRRRRSLRETSPGVGARSHKQSNLSYASNGHYGSSPPQTHEPASGPPHAGGTESTVSTAAPSTVWDELDDLKSRLRKLELTGTIPKSSNAAMSNALNERPPTATTTMTTMSSSPKRRKVDSASPEARVKDPGGTKLHPLLHSALAKAKPTVNTNLYSALEATASDALALAAMTGSAGSQEVSQAASVVGPASGIDRQLRRKADSICRSLTELCIAMTEAMQDCEHLNAKPRPGSNDSPSTVQRNEPKLPESRLLHDSGLGSEGRASSRVMSRLEARRTSLLGSSPLYGRRETTQEAATPTPTVAPSASRLDRTSTVTLRKRAKEEEEVVAKTNQRPPSRAATEIGQLRASPQTRVTREYTSQHPMPSHSDRSPAAQTSLPQRKSYFSQVSTSPLTTSAQPGNRRYLERSTPPLSTDSARLAEARQRRIASLGQHTSASQSRIGFSTGRLRQSEGVQR